ncbi:MAG: HlyD family efflux transporter periplasmic adaptor subunit [Planctomycetota bacterium]|nr:MAG: HlyD family efflux transporter periplasmic adaptor subunit [Planctomycetota bacterium]
MRGSARTRWIKRGAILTGLVAVFVAAVPVVTTLLRPAADQELLTHRVSRGDLAITVTADGTLESSENIEIKCKVKGGSTVLWVIEPGTLVSPGDVLVELDKSRIEDNITQQQINYETALANHIISQSEVEVAKTSITEYLEGTFQEEKATIEKEIFDAEEEVRAALLAYESAQRLAAKGMVGSLQLESRSFAVESARKDLELKKRRLEALEKYTKQKRLQELEAALQAAEARLAADEAALQLEKQRLEREKQQLENCTIRSPGAGLVILPSMAEWKQTPDIEEGATVHEEQTLLMIPDLNQMQVKVGIHEAKVDRLRIGMPAKVQLQGMTLMGVVDEIAEVTRPAGWWTGNIVKYDTIVKLESRPGLKPGMSAIVDVVLAEYHDVLTVPVACIVETPAGFLVWVKTATGVERRRVELGDTNDEFTIVTSGLAEGDEVVLNPTAFLEEAKLQALRTDPQGAEESEAQQEPGQADAAQPEQQAAKKDPIDPAAKAAKKP